MYCVIEQSRSYRTLIVGLLACASLVGLSVQAHAQTTLPGIVIEGASLDAGPAIGDQDAEGASGSNGAADDTTNTARRSATPGLASEKIGSAVSVVTGAQLEAQKVRHAGEALRSLPGVHVSQSGGFGNLTQVRIRGAEGNHTKVLIDGIELSDTSNNEYDFSNLLTSDIERVEVLRGGHSGIYGSEAIGGVINIITKSGKGPLTVQMSAEAGGLETRAVAGRISGGTDLFWAALSGQYRASDGFDQSPVGMEDDPFRNISTALKVGGTIIPGMIWDFTVRKTDKRLDFDNQPFGSFVVLDAENSGTSDVTLAGGKIRWDLFKGAFTQIVRGDHNKTDSTSDSPTFQSENLSKRSQFAYQATYRFATPDLLKAKHALTGLGQVETESFTPRSTFFGAPSADGVERERKQRSVAVEYRGEIANTLFFSGIIRRDNNDTFDDFTTWRASVSAPIRGTGIRPHASVGTSVALPGMFEQFGSVLNTFVGNPDLVPEESFGWDAGVEYTLPGGRTVFDVTYFRADLENEITGFGNSLRNLGGESNRSGIEVSVRSQLLPWLFVNAGYTYLNATEPDGRDEVRRPNHAAKVDVTAKFDDDRGTFSVAAIYNGEMKDNNFATSPATRVTLDDYILVNAALSYKVDPRMELFVRGENFLDQDYEEISGFNTRGLTAYAGVKIKLEDPSTRHWAR
ncbi:MAG: TonB-dependent receptor [Pseudomonadota bacterium]